MVQELNEQLISVKGNLRKKQKWKKQLIDYKKELTEIKHMIADLKEKLSSEQADVEKLEGFSVTRWLLTLKGTKEERLDKEKQEVAIVQLKLEEAIQSKDEIDQTIDELTKKIELLGNVENEYSDILQRKERYILENTSPASIQLDKLIELEGDMIVFLNELNEAVSAGSLVNQSLEKAVEFLEKAKGWGTFDLLGGGAISGAIKHSHLDRATEHIHQAQSRMRRFQKELSDIEGEADIQVNIPGLLKFADFFFDGLIADWMVQGRIEESLDKTKTHHRQIKAVLSNLEGQVTQKRREIEEIKTEKKNLIETGQGKYTYFE